MPKRKERPLLMFVRDTREGKSMVYDFAKPDARNWKDLEGCFYDESLTEGDYTVEVDGNRLPIVIERKSISDWFTVVGRERDRFLEELSRLLNYEQAYVLIEASSEAVRRGYERSKVSGLAAWSSALHWEVVYGIRFRFCGNWQQGRLMCQRLLEEFALHSLRNSTDL